MLIRLRADAAPVARALRQLYRDQLPYAQAQAINRTLDAAQRAQRLQLGRAFNLRRRDYAERSIKIRPSDRATKGSPVGIIRVETPGGGGRSDIFIQHEDGGDKRPLSGSRLAIPQEVLRTRVGIIPRGRRPRAYEFSPMGGKRRSARHVFRGKDRTWMIRNPDGSGGIYQRIGARATKKKPGAGRRMVSDLGTRTARDMNLRTLFLFTPLARLEKRLDFQDTVVRTARKEWPGRFADAFRLAVNTAR